MLLQNLRTQTAPFHTALEQNPLSLQLMSEAVTVADYKNYLRALYGYLVKFESTILSRLEESGKRLTRYKKIPLLRRDLLLLHCDTSGIPGMGEEQMMQIYPGVAAALGGLYVMEGSMLGGVVITRHLQKYLGVEVVGKLQYLGAYGNVPALHWKQFLAFFCAVACTLNETEIIGGAIATFENLDRWMRN